MNDFFIPQHGPIPMPLLNALSSMERPMVSSPRVMPSQGLRDEISRLWGPQEQIPWEQEVGRRYLDMLLGKNPNRTSMTMAPHYPDQASMFEQVTPDVIRMVMEAGISPQEFMEMLMR